MNKTRRQYNCPYGNNKKVTHLPRCRKFVEPFRQQPPLLGHVPNLALHDRALHPNTLAHVFLLANLSTKHGVSLIAYTHANKNKLTFASSIRARSGSLFSNSSLNAASQISSLSGFTTKASSRTSRAPGTSPHSQRSFAACKESTTSD